MQLELFIPSPSQSSKAESILLMISVSNDEVVVREPDVVVNFVALDILSMSEHAVESAFEHLTQQRRLSVWQNSI
jgi:hypothetical protein